MKNINSQVLRKTSAVRFTLVRFVLAAILIPAILIGSAFTFGGSNLQAQANGGSKQGFFAGFVYLSGFKVDSTKKVTTNITTTANAITGYRITGSSDATSIVANVDAVFNTQINGIIHYNGVKALLKESCETGVTSVTAYGRTYSYGSIDLDSFDAGTSKGEGTSVTTTSDGSGTIVHSNQNLFPTGTRNDGDDTNYCFTYFFGDLSSDRTSITLSAYKGVSDDSEPTTTAVIVDPTAITSSSKSDKISGIGLQFGFRWEKWRASLTHFTGKGGDNELANTLVMADYFVNEGLFVGGGLASMKLTNGSASGSATSPALRVGYKQKLTPNLSLNFGLTKYISGVSLKNSVTTNNTTTANANANTTPIVLRSFEETQTPDRGDSAVVGVSNIRFGTSQTITARYFVVPSTQMFDSDRRTPVTQVRSRTVYINEIQTPAGSETQTTTTTETDAELKAPLVISISFHLSF